MAELRVETRLKYTPAESNQVSFDTGTIKVDVDMSGADHSEGTMDVATTEETLALPGDIGTAGMVAIRNLDAANFVRVGTATGVYSVKVKATEMQVFRPTGTTLYLIADTAAVRIQYWALED